MDTHSADDLLKVLFPTRSAPRLYSYIAMPVWERISREDSHCGVWLG
jgi:hypothetical protein